MTIMFRNDVKQVSGILKRASGHEVSVDTNDEEESAYNEHFKNSSQAVSGPGEYRVPSVRVRPVQALYTAQHQDFAGTATQQGKQDGKRDLFKRTVCVTVLVKSVVTVYTSPCLFDFK